METKHTPAPWIVHDSGLVLALGPSGSVQSSEAVAYVGDDRAQVFRKSREEIALANARLIAAAPCVLEALENMQKAYGRLHDFLSDMIEGGRLTEADIPDDYAAIVEQMAGPCQKADHDAKAAIAKANGG